MNKPKLNYLIDMGMVISFLAVFVTGLMKLPLLYRHLKIIRALPSSNLTFIHDWSGIILGIFVLAHIILHFDWIVCMTKNIFRKKADKGESCEK